MVEPEEQPKTAQQVEAPEQTAVNQGPQFKMCHTWDEFFQECETLDGVDITDENRAEFERLLQIQLSNGGATQLFKEP